jgi:cysteinyl-tRNA synthetase
MYVCGMTVYDYCHLGHARVLVVFDMVRRWLRASGYRVTYVRNITDIDYKIIKRANENGESVDALTARFIGFMDQDAAALGVEKPDHEPRATHYVPQMLDLIQRLEQRKLAYQAGSGDVNYAVRRFPGYGKLSGKSLDELRAGERVDVDTSKEDPLDFVLWKRAKADEPKWPSRWGEGRPGWHIECSAMSATLLGEQFDIHGGGMDLQFPHHENEIAQTEGATGKQFVKYWMHNGFVRVDDEKMSKSLGNFFTVREILKKYDPRWCASSSCARTTAVRSTTPTRTSTTRGNPSRVFTPLCAMFLPRAVPSSGRNRMRRASRKRWTTISAPPKRSPSCSASRTRYSRAMPVHRSS